MSLKEIEITKESVSNFYKDLHKQAIEECITDKTITNKGMLSKYFDTLVDFEDWLDETYDPEEFTKFVDKLMGEYKDD